MRVLRGILLAHALSAAGATAATAAGAQEPARTNRIGMEFVLIRPGSMVVGRFQPACPTPAPVGSRRDAVDAVDVRARWTPEDYRRCEEMVKRDALPGFTVHIRRPYYIGKYEVTQAQWRRVMGTNPSVFQGSKVDGDADRHPVDNVTWEDAQAFLRKLNRMDRTARYRLPTEFEWEYAARAGAERDLTWAQIREQAQLALVDKGTTQPVGGKQPNAWGLYDTLGNVWEWVQDYYNEKLFADPTPPRTGTEHVLRGGSFLSDVKNTTYFTHGAGPGSGFDVGFRVVREVREGGESRRGSRAASAPP
jgi:formylglycine-generating enzyme